MTTLVPNHKRMMSTMPPEKDIIVSGDVLLTPSNCITVTKKIKQEEPSHEDDLVSTTMTGTKSNIFKTTKEDVSIANDDVPKTMLSRATASGTSSISTRSSNSFGSNDSNYIMTRREFNVYMTDWLRDNFIYPYPDNDIIEEMMQLSGRNRLTVNNWLSNNRSRKWYHVMEAVLAMKRPSDYYLDDCINYFDGKPLRVLPPRRRKETNTSSSDNDNDNAQKQHVGSGSERDVDSDESKHHVAPSCSPSHANLDVDACSNSCSTLTSSITSETCYATTGTPATSIATLPSNGEQDHDIVSKSIDWDSLQLPHLTSNNWIDLLDDTFDDDFSFDFNDNTDNELFVDNTNAMVDDCASETRHCSTKEDSGTNETVNTGLSNIKIQEVDMRSTSDSNEVVNLIPNNDPIHEKDMTPSHNNNESASVVPCTDSNIENKLIPSTDKSKEIDMVPTKREFLEIDNQNQENDNIPNIVCSTSHISPRRTHRYNTRRNKRWKATIERCRYITRQNKRRQIKIEYEE